ncbi:indoleamine 2,3-dioxygenase 2 [Elysia marginata]|uniref:Indoleamine 2,3-dioxygenase 2 n=1 Tax=Elysia marginata TaxID=1093978 RepID=A0AAV4EB17_9GAST|nr:indoleamine 2,3-dioxygenase 2 [Elysia marginata]
MVMAVLDLDNYDVSPHTGFMLPDPLDCLPTYFDPWNNLASNLAKLVEKRKFREEVHKVVIVQHLDTFANCSPRVKVVVIVVIVAVVVVVVVGVVVVVVVVVVLVVVVVGQVVVVGVVVP